MDSLGRRILIRWSTKAKILLALERPTEAYPILDEAVAQGNAGQVHGIGRALIAQGLKDKAMEVFKANYEKFDGAWPTEVGMTRGYSALGEYDKAIKHCKVAQEQAPDKLNQDGLAKSLEKLKMKQDIN